MGTDDHHHRRTRRLHPENDEWEVVALVLVVYALFSKEGMVGCSVLSKGKDESGIHIVMPRISLFVL